MTLDTYAAFVLFVIVMTGTPGIGNLTMMGIGQATGFRSALPFLAGTTVGMLALNSLVGLGLGGLFMASPRAALAMKCVGAAYILYLAWKLLRMQLAEAGPGRRFTFVEGVFVHPLNPKSWAMSVVGFSQLADPSLPLAAQLAVFIPTFFVFQVSFHSLWGLAGVVLLRTLRSKSVLACVNVTLVTIMVGATLYALLT
jgi:threonine/homoserine/homoserine lactone efflux protein